MAKKVISVTETGHGVHVKIDADDNVATLDHMFKIKAKDKSHVPTIVAAWREVEAKVNAAPTVKDGLIVALETMLDHVRQMDDAFKKAGFKTE